MKNLRDTGMFSVREHSEKWFAKQEARLQEPLKNTERYYLYKFWLMIWLLPTLIGTYWAVKAIIELRRKSKNLKTFTEYRNDIMSKGRTITNDGPPGAGKTFTGANMAYFLAQQRWQELISDYYTQKAMTAEWIKNGETDKLNAFRALEESYVYFAERERENIPCLVSSIPLREYGTGRMSYVLNNEMFFQIERVPEYTVIFNDESGKDSGADKSKTDKAELLEFWRFPRHFFDGMFVNTNQDGGQNGIFVRRSTDYNNHLYGQEWLQRPERLLNKIERKEQRYFKKLYRGKLTEEKAEYIAQELYYQKKYAATIGFRAVSHQMATPQGVIIQDKEVYIFPAIGGVEYDDRCFRNLYRCKDEEIKLQGWEKMVVNENGGEIFDKLLNESARI